MQAKAGDPFIQNVVKGIYTCEGHFFFFNPEMESSVHKLRVGDEERRHPVSGKGLGGESGGLSSALPPSDCGASVWGLPSAQHCSAP